MATSGSMNANVLGDVRAENDHAMLDSAFHEWQDYKSIFESDDRFVVVGRRGTGKSALTYRLKKEFDEKHYFVVLVDPNEEEFIGLRGVAEQFGNSVQRVRAAIKLAWRYALIMEIAAHLSEHYKTGEQLRSSTLNNYLREWRRHGSSTISNIKSALRSTIRTNESLEERISELASRLHVDEVTRLLVEIMGGINKKIVVLVDRLDEGYEPDAVGATSPRFE